MGWCSSWCGCHKTCYVIKWCLALGLLLLIVRLHAMPYTVQTVLHYLYISMPGDRRTVYAWYNYCNSEYTSFKNILYQCLTYKNTFPCLS